MAPEKPVEPSRKFFSIEEANNSLPLVKAIVGDIVRQFELVNFRKQQLIALKNRRRGASANAEVLGQEMVQSQAELEQEEGQLDSYIDELSRLGVKLKGFDGLCDFPSLREGREVYLCWRLGEQGVRFWHEINAGFAGRQPLDGSPIRDKHVH